MRGEQAKTTLRLDFKIHKKLRLLAIEKNSTLAALVDQALREFIGRESKRKNRGKP